MAGLGALLLAAACTGGGGASTTPTATATSATATPSPTAAATATPTATVEPTATPPASGAPPIVIEPSDALTVREFAPGERLDAEHGVFIADATTGAGELWAVNQDLVPSEFDLRSLQSSPDGRFVTARVVDTSFLADRTTGAGFRWDADAFRMVGFPDGEGRALFVSDDEECWFYAVEFRASAAALLASSRLSEPPERCPQLEGLFSPDGGSLFLQAGARVRGLPATAGLYVVNLASGAIEEAGRLPGSSVTLHARVDWLRGHRAGDAELRAAAHRGPALRLGRDAAWRGARVLDRPAQHVDRGRTPLPRRAVDRLAGALATRHPARRRRTGALAGRRPRRSPDGRGAVPRRSRVADQRHGRARLARRQLGNRGRHGRRVCDPIRERRRAHVARVRDRLPLRAAAHARTPRPAALRLRRQGRRSRRRGRAPGRGRRRGLGADLGRVHPLRVGRDRRGAPL